LLQQTIGGTKASFVLFSFYEQIKIKDVIGQWLEMWTTKGEGGGIVAHQFIVYHDPGDERACLTIDFHSMLVLHGRRLELLPGHRKVFRFDPNQTVF
jgi:hypothetical protein